MSTPLRDLLTTILFDPPARAAFDADPDGFLGEHGWGDLDGADVQAALGALADELPVERAQLLFPALEGNGHDDGWPDGAVDSLHLAIGAVDEGHGLDVGAVAEEAVTVGEGDGAERDGVGGDPSDSLDAAGHDLAPDVDLDDLDRDRPELDRDDLDRDGLDQRHVGGDRPDPEGDQDGDSEAFGSGGDHLDGLDPVAIDRADELLDEVDDGAPTDLPTSGIPDEPDAPDEARFYDPTLDEEGLELDRPDDPDDPTQA